MQNKDGRHSSHADKHSSQDVKSQTHTNKSTSPENPPSCDICLGLFMHSREAHQNHTPARCIGIYKSITDFDKNTAASLKQKSDKFDKLLQLQPKERLNKSSSSDKDYEIYLAGIGLYFYTDRGIGQDSVFRTIFGVTSRIIGVDDDTESPAVMTEEMKKLRYEQLQKELQEAREKLKVGVLAERDPFELPEFSMEDLIEKIKSAHKIRSRELWEMKDRYVKCSLGIMYKMPEVFLGLPQSVGSMANRLASRFRVMIERRKVMLEDVWKDRTKREEDERKKGGK